MQDGASGPSRLVAGANAGIPERLVSKSSQGSCAGTDSTAVLGIRVEEVFVRRMECLDYIVIHEMAHLIEPTRHARFTSLMDRVMPNSLQYISYENWGGSAGAANLSRFDRREPIAMPLGYERGK